MTPTAPHRRTSGVRTVLSALALGAVCACGDTDSSGSSADAGGDTFGPDVGTDATVGDATPDASVEPGPSPARDGFVLENLGVGARWYDYDEVTHALSPKPEHYVVRSGGEAFRVRVLSYYNIDGESGFFTLSVSAWSGSDWGEPAFFESEDNVKDAPVCVDLRAVSAVPCDGEHDLVMRSDRRAVPAAGFAVAEPGIFVAAHRFEASDVDVWRVDADAAFDPFAPTSVGISAISSFRDPAQRVLRDLANPGEDWVVLHGTASFRICAWAVDDSADPLILESRCAPLSASAAAQASLADAASVESSVVAPAEGESVSLRFGEDGGLTEADRTSGFRVGLWGDNREFDLVVERAEGGFVYLVGPGALVHVRDRAATGDGVYDLPASLWDQ